MGSIKKIIAVITTMLLLVALVSANQEKAIDSLKQRIQELEETIDNMQVDVEILKSGGIEEETKPFSIYGYFGFRYHNFKWTNGNIIEYHLLADSRPSFSQTNVNLYFQFNPTDNVEMLSEIRFLYQPKGYMYTELGDVEPDMTTMQKRDYVYTLNIPNVGETPIPVPVPLTSTGSDAILTNSDGIPIDQDGNPIITDNYLYQFLSEDGFNADAFIADYLTHVIFIGTPAFSKYFIYPATMPTYFLDLTNAINYNWGGINVERAWVSLVYNEHLKFKFGKFFTPFGIWNVDHGLPVLLTARVPFFLAYVPQNQTGIQLYGNYFFPHSTLEYYAYISNGRGPEPETKDNNDNKALGGRLALTFQTPTFKTLSAGISFFTGDYSIDRDSIIVEYNSDLGFFTTKPEFAHTIDYTEQTLGLDFKLHYKGLIIQSEYLNTKHNYNEFNPIQEGLFPVQKLPDITAYYVQTGFELPWKLFDWTFTPYFRYENIDGFVMGSNQSPVQSTPLNETLTIMSPGINIRINPFVILKIDYTKSEFEKLDMKFDMITTSLSVSF